MSDPLDNELRSRIGKEPAKAAAHSVPDNLSDQLTGRRRRRRAVRAAIAVACVAGVTAAGSYTVNALTKGDTRVEVVGQDSRQPSDPQFDDLENLEHTPEAKKYVREYTASLPNWGQLENKLAGTRGVVDRVVEDESAPISSLVTLDYFDSSVPSIAQGIAEGRCLSGFGYRNELSISLSGQRSWLDREADINSVVLRSSGGAENPGTDEADKQQAHVLNQEMGLKGGEEPLLVQFPGTHKQGEEVPESIAASCSLAASLAFFDSLDDATRYEGLKNFMKELEHTRNVTSDKDSTVQASYQRWIGCMSDKGFPGMTRNFAQAGQTKAEYLENDDFIPTYNDCTKSAGVHEALVPVMRGIEADLARQHAPKIDDFVALSLTYRQAAAVILKTTVDSQT